MNILEEAQKVVSERRDNYGGPEVNFQRIAAMWKVILKEYPITQTEVALMMIAVKMCRQMYSPQRDNWTDIAGYAECGDLVSRPFADPENHVPKKACSHLEVAHGGGHCTKGTCKACGIEMIKIPIVGNWIPVIGTLGTDEKVTFHEKTCQHKNIDPIKNGHYCQDCQQTVHFTTEGWRVKKACQHPPEKVNTTGPRAYCHHCQQYVIQDTTGEQKWITDPDPTSCSCSSTTPLRKYTELGYECNKCGQMWVWVDDAWVRSDTKACQHSITNIVNGQGFCAECLQPMINDPSGKWIPF